MSIQLISIRLKKFYFVSIVLSPLWIAAPILIQRAGGSQFLAIILGLFILTITGVIAQKIARKITDLKVENKTVSFDDTSLLIQDIKDIKINKSGIGTSAIEFNLKTGKKVILHLINIKGNADKGIAFAEKNLPEIEFIAPEDLLN